MKEEKLEYIGEGLNWEEITEISNIRKDLDDIEKLGATHIQIDSELSVRILPFMMRLETDEEYKKRTDIVKERNERITKNELALLERLKLKYEKPQS